MFNSKHKGLIFSLLTAGTSFFLFQNFIAKPNPKKNPIVGSYSIVSVTDESCEIGGTCQSNKVTFKSQQSITINPDYSFNGKAACNGYGGQINTHSISPAKGVKIQGNELYIAIEKLTSTNMACDLIDEEQVLFDNLNHAYKISYQLPATNSNGVQKISIYSKSDVSGKQSILELVLLGSMPPVPVDPKPPGPPPGGPFPGGGGGTSGSGTSGGSDSGSTGGGTIPNHIVNAMASLLGEYNVVSYFKTLPCQRDPKNRCMIASIKQPFKSSQTLSLQKKHILSAQGACNKIGGKYATSIPKQNRASLRISQLASSAASCDLIDEETIFLNLLQSAAFIQKNSDVDYSIITTNGSELQLQKQINVPVSQ